ASSNPSPCGSSWSSISPANTIVTSCSSVWSCWSSGCAGLRRCLTSRCVSRRWPFDPNLAKLMTEAMPIAPSLHAVTKEVLVDGKLLKKESVVINDQAFSFSRGALRVASLEEEWFEDVRDPELAIDGLRRCTPAPDLFTFWQRIPDLQPHYSYHHEWESLAVVPITTYEEWWNKRVKGTTRNMVRKSQKAGVELREAEFDDAF